MIRAYFYDNFIVKQRKRVCCLTFLDDFLGF